MSRIIFPVLAFILLGAGPASAHGGHHQAAPAVSQAWARATPATIKTGAAYVEIKANEHADRLIGASTTMADRVEIHTHKMDGDKMSMEKVDGIDIPAGSVVKFDPGGYHFMLINLRGQLKAGEKLPLLLEFATSGRVKVMAEILPAWARGPDDKTAGDHSKHGADHSQHMDHSKHGADHSQHMDHSKHGADHSQHMDHSKHGADHSQHMDHSKHGADHSQHKAGEHSEHHDHTKH